VDSFQLELAVKFCERALELEPENVKVLDTLAPLLLETGDTEHAQEVRSQSVVTNEVDVRRNRSAWLCRLTPVFQSCPL